MFVYQSALDRLDLKKEEGTDYVFLCGNQGRGWECVCEGGGSVVVLNLSHYILLSFISKKFLDIRWE